MTNSPPMNTVKPPEAPSPLGRPKKRRFLRIGGIGGIVVAAIAGSALVLGAMQFQRPPPVQPPHAEGLNVRSETAVSVAPGCPQWKVLKLGQVEKAKGGWTDPVPGRVKIDERISSKVGSPLTGRVSQVLVDLGAHVKAGDRLFRVSSPDLADLRAQKRKADVDYAAARVVVDRVAALVEAHALPQKDQQSAEQTLEQAELTRDAAVSKLAALHVAADGDAVTDSFYVTSPQDGIVVEKNLVAHQEVAPDGANPLLVVADLSTVWVVADLFEADAIDIKEGAKVEVTQARAASNPIEAVVDAVSAIVDPNRHTVPVRVRVPNSGGDLRPNAFATVRFAMAEDDKALSIPATSIVSDGAKQYVYVWGDDKNFTRRDVITGASAGGRMTVLAGLREGETILVEGGILLDNQIQLGSQG
jgi:cobalt-zinc-cadmium efflux system membrane fusion protein